MFRLTARALLDPRFFNNTPPPLIKKPGEFICKCCKHRWRSNNVMVTKRTHKVYQGESCTECGTTNKPQYVGRFKEDLHTGRRASPHGQHLNLSNKSRAHMAKLDKGRKQGTRL